jgi:hypothetical protein
MNRVEIVMNNAKFYGYLHGRHNFMQIGTVAERRKYVAMRMTTAPDEFHILRWNLVDGKDRFTWLPRKFVDLLMLAVYPHQPD